MIRAWLTWLVWLGVLAALGCALSQPWFALFFGVSFFLPLLLLLVYRLFPPKLAAAGDFPQTAEKNRKCSGTVTVTNERRLLYRCVRLEIVLENALTGEAVRRTLCAPLYPREQACFRMTFCGQYCGVVRAREMKVRLYDYFGLGFQTLRLQLPVQTVILPRSYPVEYRLMAAGSADDRWEDYSSARAGQDMSEPFDFRDYAPGDAGNRIHWRLSDKYERLIVREGSEQAEQAVALLLANGRQGGETAAPEAAAAMAELFISLSLAFCDDGINHLLGVWNGAGDDYDVYEIGCEEDVICLLPRLLVTAGEAVPAAECSPEREALRKASHLLLVTNRLSEVWLEPEADMADSGQLRTVLLVGRAADAAAENDGVFAGSGVRVLRVNSGEPGGTVIEI